jgi:hypothetical protein
VRRELVLHCSKRPNIARFIEHNGVVYIETTVKLGDTPVACLVEVDRLQFAERMRAWLA